MVSQTLSQTQQQRQLLTLSPMQIRYFKMLEMNRVQAEEEVRKELDENPALEVADTPVDTPDFNETAEELQMADYRDEDDIPFYRLEANNRSADDSRYTPEAVAQGDTLSQHLSAELDMIDGIDPMLLAAAKYVAANLDSNGYMTRSQSEMIDDIAFSTGITVSPERMKEAVALVRTLDPAGVGAVDLRDCLVLQLDRMPRDKVTENAREIVTHYFDLFSHKHFDRLRSALGVSDEEVRAAIERIRSLNPKPGSLIETSDASDRLRHVTPDFIVETDGEGNVTASVINSIPELQVEATFAVDSAGNSTANAFIRRQRDEANGFISIVRLRNETLLKVITAIVKIQHRFFATGLETDFRPMILKDISAMTGLDASVVSRATNGKYVMTPWGVFPLKFFFSERFNHDDEEGGDAVSSREIMAELRQMIENEDRRRPLADRELAAMLEEKGRKVARRTVAKYREMLGFPVARLRREF